jgi:nucleoid-associated protein YgaU
LELSQKQDGDVTVTSVDKVLVLPFESDAEEAPNLVLAKPESIEILAEPRIAKVEILETKTPDKAVVVSDVLSLDTIVYDDLGSVVISGRGNSSDFVRIYLDNKPTEVQKIPDNGQWKISLTDVPDGLYALRVDSVDASGAVTERVQSPFKRETTDAVIASTKKDAANVTIQPGYTLWALAENKYGDGTRYVHIFEANRDHIKDPDLIYPGQIFDLPG